MCKHLVFILYVHSTDRFSSQWSKVRAKQKRKKCSLRVLLVCVGSAGVDGGSVWWCIMRRSLCVPASAALPCHRSLHSPVSLPPARSLSPAAPFPSTLAAHRTEPSRRVCSIRSVARLESCLCLSHPLVCTLSHSHCHHAPCARVDAAASGCSRSGRTVGRSRSAAPRSWRTRSAAGARHECGIEEKQEGWHPG